MAGAVVGGGVTCVLPQGWPSVGVPDPTTYLEGKLAFPGFRDSGENPVRVFQCRVEMCFLIKNWCPSWPV